MSEVAKKEKKGGKKLLILLLALLLVGGGTAGILAATAGYGNKTEVEVSSYDELKKAVEGTKSERTVILAGDIEMEGPISVPAGKKVVITDNGTARTLVRQSGMEDAFFRVEAGADLTVQGTADKMLVLSGDPATEAGLEGALIVSEGNVTLDKVTAKDNLSESLYGGVVRSTGGAVVLKDSTFTGNTAECGAVVYLEGGTLSADNCVFDSNTATFGHGGAIYGYKNAKVDLKNCEFTKNSLPNKSGSYGGAVALQDACSGTVENCVFDGNTITHEGNANGGAIYVGTGSKLKVSGKNEFKNNVIKNLEYALGGAIYADGKSTVTIEAGSVFENNTATHGGALYNRSSTFTVEGAEFIGNKSTIGHGGAMYTYDAGTTTFKNCTFKNNSVVGNGDTFGGAVAIVSKSKCIMTDCTFDSNFVEHNGNAYGGAMYIGLASTLNASGKNVFTNNYGKSLDGNNALGGALYANTDCFVSFAEGAEFVGNSGSHGGALYIAAARGLVTGAVFEDNHSYKSHGGAMMTYKGDIELSECVFKNNSVDAEGDFYGGALAVVQLSKARLVDCEFTGNSVDHSGKNRGGAVYVGMESTADVEGGKFTGNRTRGGDNNTGGAIYVNIDCTVTVSGAAFTNNSSGFGGAMHVVSGGKLSVSNSTFTGNSGNRHGGAVAATSKGVLNLTGCTFKNNTVKSDDVYFGGAVTVNTESTANIKNCTFVGNKAESTADDCTGGAMYIGKSSKVTISGSTFQENSSSSAEVPYGGAIYANDGTVTTISSSKFVGNTSGRGGAIYANNGAIFNIDGATFTGNSGDNHGGAIMAYKSEVNVKNSAFTENFVKSEGDFYGGAMAMLQSSKGVLENNTFDGNYVTTTSQNGNAGALYIGYESDVDIIGGTVKNSYSTSAKNMFGGALYMNQNSVVDITGTVFEGNHGGRGGAIYANTGTTLNIDGATFTGNYTTAEHGGAIMTYSAALSAKNTSFTGNYVTAPKAFYGGALAILQSSAAALENCVFDGNYVDNATGNSNGGAIYGGNTSNITITGINEFKNNAGKGTGNAYGGAIYINNSTVVDVAEGTTFTNNSGSAGGALSTFGGIFKINGATFTGNTATTGVGDVLYNGNSSGHVTTVSFTNSEIVSADNAASDIALGAGHVLEVSGKNALGRVSYGSDATLIKLAAALEEGSSMTLIPAKYEVGLQVVTADDAALLAGIGAKSSVPAQGETLWGVDDAGKLADVTPEAWIGETMYDKLSDALAAAKEGDVVKATGKNPVDADITVPAGVKLEVAEGKTLTLADGVKLTLGENAVLTGAVKGDVVAGNGADLTGAAVTGTVTAAENAVVNVGGGFTAAKVHLSAGAKLNVVSALTTETPISLTSAVETVGTVLVTGSDVAAAVEKLAAQFTDTNVLLGADGIIVEDPTVATITKDGVTVKYNSLEDAIAAAAADDVIVLNKNVVVNATVEVAKALTIDGAQKVISRGDALTAAMFNVTAEGTLTLGNVILDGNRDKVTATAAMIVNAGTLNVNAGTTMRNAYNSTQNATASGGAITSKGTANIVGTQPAGAEAAYDVVFENCKSGRGGAIMVTGGTTKVQYVKFTGCEASAGGGGLATGAASVTEITDCLFTGCKQVMDSITPAWGGGGAIYSGHASGKVTVTNTTMENCVAEHTGTSNAGGGAIHNYAARNANKVTLQNCTIINCTAANMGGAIYNRSAGQIDVLATTIDTCSAKHGGAVANTGSNSTVTLGEGTVVKSCSVNTSNGGGGAVWNESGAITNVAGAELVNNTAVNGGAIYHKGGTVNTSANAKITTCTATNQGGAIYVTGAALNMADTVVDGCRAANASAIYATAANAKVTLNSGTVLQNGVASVEGKDSAGTIINEVGSTLVLNSGSSILNNTAVNGAAIYNKATATINAGVTISGNKSTKLGVIYNGNGTVAAVLTINGGTFESNSTSSTTNTHGGAVLYNHSNATATIVDGTFKNNSSAFSGGAIYNLGTLEIKGGLFEGNTAGKTSGQGGVINNGNNKYSAVLTISGGTFRNNVSGGKGGVLFTWSYPAGNFYSTATISGGVFEGNVAKDADGGGVIASNDGSNLYVTGGTFLNNKALASEGGAINTYTTTTAEITGGVFEGNMSKGKSGALYIGGGKKLTIGGTAEFKNNSGAVTFDASGNATTAGNGADVAIGKSNATLTLTGTPKLNKIVKLNATASLIVDEGGLIASTPIEVVS